ncbi:hypothetical protein I7I53_04551 [Histoplasma capsulatum var. duboisii H88]|uniref:Uncharacterized protein n=1 Tax=Ajellomyces capsulatus (strain H88) TaxID=544711 RepID=A0A8A1LUW5_AJEC8|nr:hypothetical protein I7I53_04551 [Histoplasma capsulatum var. duboisii H88]
MQIQASIPLLFRGHKKKKTPPKIAFLSNCPAFARCTTRRGPKKKK